MTQVTLIKFCDTAPLTVTEPGTMKHIPIECEKNPSGGWLVKLDRPDLVSNCIKNNDYFLVSPEEYTGARVPNSCTGVERKRFDFKAITPEELAAGRKMQPIEIYRARDAAKTEGATAEKAEATDAEAPESDESVGDTVPAKRTWSRRPKNKE